MAELIIFDWKRTLYSPENSDLIEGSLDVLQTLEAKGLRLLLVGKDLDDSMPGETSRLEVSRYFQEIHFVQDSKTSEDIAQFIDPEHPELAVVVGDRIRSEIKIGNQLGLTTIWVRQGKFADENPLQPDETPSHTIDNITEIIPLIDNI